MDLDAPRREHPPAAVTDAELAELRSWNLGLTVMHALQAITILYLARDYSLPIITTFATEVPGTRVAPVHLLLEVPLGIAVAAFLGLAALNHLVAATVLRGIYERDLRRGLNRLRWVEYAVSATWMIVLISLFVGIHDVTALIALAGTSIAALLYGWLQELMNPPGAARTTLLPFVLGAVAGVVPWIAIVVSLVGAGQVPGYVTGIVALQGLLFALFALNAVLHHLEIEAWKDYAYTERTYQLLSLVAKSLLGWQIFAGTLMGA